MFSLDMGRLIDPFPILALVQGQEKTKADGESIIWKYIVIHLRGQEET